MKRIWNIAIPGLIEKYCRGIRLEWLNKTIKTSFMIAVKRPRFEPNTCLLQVAARPTCQVNAWQLRILKKTAVACLKILSQ
jgi:hypothetical protein